MKLNTILNIILAASCISASYLLLSNMDKKAELEELEKARARIISPYEFQQLRKECKKKPECYSQKVWELEHKKIDYI